MKTKPQPRWMRPEVGDRWHKTNPDGSETRLFVTRVSKKKIRLRDLDGCIHECLFENYLIRSRNSIAQGARHVPRRRS